MYSTIVWSNSATKNGRIEHLLYNTKTRELNVRMLEKRWRQKCLKRTVEFVLINKHEEELDELGNNVYLYFSVFWLSQAFLRQFFFPLDFSFQRWFLTLFLLCGANSLNKRTWLDSMYAQLATKWIPRWYYIVHSTVYVDTCTLRWVVWISVCTSLRKQKLPLRYRPSISYSRSHFHR